MRNQAPARFGKSFSWAILRNSKEVRFPNTRATTVSVSRFRTSLGSFFRFLGLDI